MMRSDCCFGCKNSDAEDEVEKGNSEFESMKEKILKDAKRRSLLDYIERLRCEPMQNFETSTCYSSMKNNPVAKIKRLKKSVRRSSALINSRMNIKTDDENENCEFCSGSTITAKPDYQGSILRGETRATETQTSRSQSRNSLVNLSCTKGSPNLRKKFCHLDKISNDSSDLLTTRATTPFRRCCRCFNNRSSKTASKNNFTRCNDAIVTNLISNSEDEIIDYQVPIEPSLSSHRFYGSGSGSRTLVPTSSHVTIRICSRNSNDSLNCDQYYDEECTDESRFCGLKNSSSLDEKCSCCCKCGEIIIPECVDLEKRSDSNSFQRFKDVVKETKRRKPLQFHSGPSKGVFGICGNTRRCEEHRKLDRNKPVRRSIAKNKRKNYGTSTSYEVCDPPIILTPRRYEQFREKCEKIKKSIGNECKSRGEADIEETPVWKGDEFTLYDFSPDLPPLDHWSQYEDGLKKATEEYRTLKSCLNMVEDESVKGSPTSCSCTEKSITRTYPSGTEFTFKVKRVPEKKAKKSGAVLDSKKSDLRKRREKIINKTRSVCFEKSKKEKKSCCECLDDDVKQPCENNGFENIEASCAEMKEREVDLIRTLEIFCEKLRSMRSEFEKPVAPVYLRNSACCKTCGRGSEGFRSNKTKAKKLLIFPPHGENGPPLTLYKNSSDVNCRVKGNPKNGFQYKVTYVQRFVSPTWKPEKHECHVDSG